MDDLQSYRIIIRFQIL